MTTCPLFNSGSVVITKDNYYEILPQIYERTVGTKITPSCNDGLRLVGVSEFTCLSSGTWSYSTKPYCTAEPANADDNAPDENTWILIGVVCGVAFIIICILIIMIVAIWYRDRKRNKQQELMMYNVNRMYSTNKPYGPTPAPYTSNEEIEMYGRSRPPPSPPPPPPPPYESGSRVGQDHYHYSKYRDGERYRDLYDRYRDRDPYYEKKRRSREFLSDVGLRRSIHDYDGERRPRLSSRMYLPEREDHEYGEPKSLYHKSRSFDDISDYGRSPYDEPWVRRDPRSSAYDDMYVDRRPGDSRLWRNVSNLHLKCFVCHRQSHSDENKKRKMLRECHNQRRESIQAIEGIGERKRRKVVITKHYR